MRYGFLIRLALAAVVAPSGVAFAHHAITGWDSKDITLQGVVVEYDYMNPHSELVLDVRDQSGSVVRWKVEMNGLITLKRNGWSKESLKPGEMITIDGPRSLNGENLLRAVKVVKADGTRLHCPASGALDCV
jgi:hypothetical protein